MMPQHPYVTEAGNRDGICIKLCDSLGSFRSCVVGTAIYDDVQVRRVEPGEGEIEVLSDEFELVSSRSGELPFMPCKDRATRQERRHGFA